MNPLDKAVGNYLELVRDSRRPPLELVLQVIEEAFGSFQILARKVLDGSDGSNTWMWEEMGLEDTLPKYYVLTTSTAPGLEGYPLLTIRQAYSLKLDTWITVSSIVPGPDADGIAHSMSLLIAQHACAFAGVKLGTSTVAVNKGHPHAAVLAAAQLMQQEPFEFDDVGEEVRSKIAELSGDPKKDVN